MDDPFDPWFTPQKPSFYQKWVPPLAVAAVGIWCVVLRFAHIYPPVGTYIAILAFMAVVVTIWPPEHAWSKAAWLATFFFLMGFEIHNLYRDRAQHDQQLALQRQMETDAFQTIADGLSSAITQSQQHFDATVERVEGVSQLTQKSIGTVTGGDGFCYMTFEAKSLEDGMAFPMFSNAGKYPLYQVSARITDLKKLAAAVPFGRKGIFFKEGLVAMRNIEVGELTPGRSRMMPRIVFDLRDKSDQYYTVVFDARNGTWIQSIRLTYIKDHWQLATKVMQGEDLNGKVRLSIVDPGYPSPIDKVDWLFKRSSQ